ncbi:MAG TPA: hypothetical protein VFT61_05590 [Sphingomicrobium sp.]|nr:hypothetical protein [Sphingomicrobium sp.]
MQWLVALLVLGLLMLVMPSAVRFAIKSARGKRGLGGATLALGIAFAFIFDPPKAAAIENIQKKNENDDEEGEGSSDGGGRRFFDHRR